MSTAPRLKGVAGFSWAPRTPYVRPLLSAVTDDALGLYSSHEGANSELGLITSKGLVADWLVYIIQPMHARLYQASPQAEIVDTCNGERIEKIIPETRVMNNGWDTAIKLLHNQDIK